MFEKSIFQVYVVAAVAVLGAGAAGMAIAHEGSMHADDAKVAQPALSAEGKRIVTALEDYAAAVQMGNLDEIEKYVLTSDVFTSLEGANQEDGAFQEDAVYLDVSWNNYRQHLADELPMLVDSSYSLRDIRPFVHGNLAYATMQYVMTFTIKSDQFKSGESRFTMKGKATMVLWKSGSEWKIRHRHTTAGKSTRH